MTIKRLLAAFGVALGFALPATAANIFIVNFDGPGEGFNDPTPAAPVGGNPGTTLGQQRLNAFAHAAGIWGAQLQSTVDIYVGARMDPLSCNATSAVLGSAGPTFVNRDWPGVPVAGHWYHIALANKLFGDDFVPDFVHISARFNSNLGQPNCLAGSPFYLGLDANHGTAIDLVAVLLHEFGHGLGFSTTTNGQTGAYAADAEGGWPSIYDKFAYDNDAFKAWDQMTNAERQASAVNARRLVWNGPYTWLSALFTLEFGSPQLQVTKPFNIAGIYAVGVADFGPQLDDKRVEQKLGQVVDQPNGTGLACTPLDETNARAVKSRVALVDRGTCGFAVKAKNVQDAGAKGMIVVENVNVAPPSDMSGVDPTIKIPSVRVTLATGNLLKAAIADEATSPRNSGVHVQLEVNRLQMRGADRLGRVMLFTPFPFQPGSSVSHWDTSAFRNLLMEPFINADLTHSVKPPQDLTLPMFKDIGW